MLNVCFLVPPVLKGEHPAERSSGCTRVVYPTPNIYELQVAACVKEAGHNVKYIDCINTSHSLQELLTSRNDPKNQAFIIWTVNLSVENDRDVVRRIHQIFPQVYVILCNTNPKCSIR